LNAIFITKHEKRGNPVSADQLPETIAIGIFLNTKKTMAPTIPKKMPSKVSEISKEVHIYHYNIINKKNKSLLEEIKK